MAYKRYYSAYGRIVKELVVGEQTGCLVPDALGSVVNVTNKTNVSTYSARYKAYGAVLTSTGTAPSFTWVGRWGYNSAAGRSHCGAYVRRRILSTAEGRWTSVDRLWPAERAYSYAVGNPASRIDAIGLQVVPPAGGPCPPISCTTTCNDYVIRLCFGCRPGDAACQQACNQASIAYYLSCEFNPPPGRPPKPPLSGQPTGWQPVHGLGVVPTYNPFAPPAPPPSPCFASVPDCSVPEKDFDWCMERSLRKHPGLPGLGVGTEPIDPTETMSFEVCKACMTRNTPPGCPPDQDAIRACWWRSLEVNNPVRG